MNNSEYISQHQLSCLILGMLLGTSLILSFGIKEAKRDVWVCELIGGLVGIIVMIMVTYIVSKSKYNTIGDIIEHLVGKIAAKIMMTYFFIVSFFLAALIINDIAVFMNVMIMIMTPKYVFAVTISVAAALILSKGIEIFTRCCEMFVPFVTLVLSVLIVLVLVKPFESYNLTPMFTSSLGDIVKASIIIATFPYVESALLIFLIPLVNKKNGIYKSNLKSVIVGVFFLTLRSVLAIGVYGVSQASTLVYPVFATVRAIQYGEFFTRVELSMIFIWFMTTFIKLSISMYISSVCIQYLFSLKDYRSIVMPQSILMVPVSLVTFTNYPEVQSFNTEGWVFMAGILFLNILILFMITLIKRPKDS